jgi:hypothetical protein
MAAHLFSVLKKEKYRVELVTEYIKFWTYLNQHPSSWDSYYCQAQQIHQEDVVLRAGVELIISDSPLFLAYCYSMMQNNSYSEVILKTCLLFDEMYPPLNILMDRGSIPYDNLGRFESKDQAIEVDRVIETLLIKNNIPFYKFSPTGPDQISHYVLNKLREHNER